MNNNARFDRPTDTFELEVNVPRTIGILRDGVEIFSRYLKATRWLKVRF